jgi:hypothetical protein
MKTVSLDDFTPESRKHMEETGRSTYKKHLWAEKELSGVVIPTWETLEEKHIGLQEIMAAAAEAAEKPDWGRWTWGDYNTLSYMWGDPSIKRRAVLVNDQVMEITQNLWDYFHSEMLDPSHSSERLWLWVDAICIDQRNIEERSAQVKRMKHIYDQAQGCVAWLGPASNDSGKAMDLLYNIGMEQFESQAEIVTYLAAICEDPDAFGTGAWKALADFVSRPYWSRLWVMQEIVLSKHALVIACGGRSILWAHLYMGISLLSNDLSVAGSCLYHNLDHENENSAAETFEAMWKSFIDRLARLQKLSTLYKIKDRGEESLYSIDTIVPLAQTAHQTDERDKVYGILSLIDERIVKLIEPDYTLSTEETYLNFVVAAIKATQSLDIVCQSRFNSSGRKRIPTWVVDLSAELVVATEMATAVPYHTSKGRACSPRFQDSTLLVEGFVFDRIDGLAANQKVTDDYYDTIIAPKHTANVYGSELDIREALWRTVVGNRDGFGNNVPDSWSGLLRIPWVMEDTEHDSYGYYSEFLARTQLFAIGGKPFSSYFHTEGETDILNGDWVRAATMRVVDLAQGRRFITTDNGYIGMAVSNARQGDLIVIAFGSSVPLIFRPAVQDDTYILVGESYIHGVMDGEAIGMLEEGKFSVENFTLL